MDKPVKKVTFNERVAVIYFKKIPVEANLCWQEVARDRMRFKRRILDVERHIGWVFTEQHRKLIYKMIYDL